MLSGKCVVLGVTGSIAAYKAANLASMLVKLNCDVHVIMTQNAVNIINPITFETITRNKCLIDTFDRNFQFNVAHISLAQKADVFMIAPASANIIGKIAGGIADDMLSTTVMATKAPCFIAPAMNTAMYENPIVQDNLKKLKKFGYNIIEPDSGFLACRDSGKGKLPNETVLLSYITKEIAYPHDLKGRKILITAGPTRESIDPVRFISNHSTGKMGFSLARQAMLRGADVLLVKGPVSIEPPPFVKVIDVVTAQEMFDAVTENFKNYDIIIKSAAVADYRPSKVSDQKIKKKSDDMSIELERTQDILGYIGANRRDGQFICGFSMETENMIENSREKLLRKNIDMIAANNLKQSGAGFAGDTNIVTIITRDAQEQLPLLSKDETADRILSSIMESYKKSGDPMTVTYKFKYVGVNGFVPLFSFDDLVLATVDDREELIATDFFDDEQEVDRFIDDPSIYIYRIKGELVAVGTLLPAYWRDDLTDDRIREVGMYVSEKYRGKHLGRSMVHIMTQLCLEKKLIPIAECLISNRASKATLESVGYVLDPQYL
ncbi:MAG: bifunctional phosphopantothenoylcysteine decarboxylase/phosphopantothenate--cysteine ligase CoaBC [Ruminococcus sp.]|nr:bifunctional phosphopantothenoylcysteine decarboxylase/phosphopantothenate--cysteine ligase CoaBC [Ruminococcus sp.]